MSDAKLFISISNDGDETEFNNTGDEDHDNANDLTRVKKLYTTSAQSKTLRRTYSAEDESSVYITPFTRIRAILDIMYQAGKDISRPSEVCM